LNVIYRKRETMVLLAQAAGTAACVRPAQCKAAGLYPGPEFGLPSHRQCGKLHPPQAPSHLNALAMSTPASSKHTRSTPLPIYRQVWHPIASIAIGLSLLAPSFAALCKELTRNQTTSNDKANSKKNGTKVTHHRSPSEETRTERDRRLYRECKGMPNAGACLGYTRR